MRLAVVLLLVVLAPFFLLGRTVEAWASSARTPWLLGALLALDVVLPVPSSLVATAAGALLGFLAGALTTWIGMSAGCLGGYWLGRLPVARRLAGAKDLERVTRLAARFGAWTLIVCRTVPVLAEASVLAAGMARMPLQRFLSATLPANLGIALAYSAVGALSMRIESFLLAFAGAILVPAAAMLLTRR